MKISARDARRILERPEPTVAGYLLYGPEPGETASRRSDLVRSLLGSDGDDALTRLDGSQVQRDPAALSDGLRSTGFFASRSIVLVEDATDGAAPAIWSAVEGLAPAQGVLVVTGRDLKPRSKLRKLFESERSLASIGVYPNPLGRAEIEQLLGAFGAPAPTQDAMQELQALASSLDTGEFRGLLSKLALYSAGCQEIAAADVAECAPLSIEGEVDALVAAVANGKVSQVPALLARLNGQGAAPSSISVGVVRHFRQLQALASSPRGPEAAAAQARPPIFGPRRDAMTAQIRGLGRANIEAALSALTETELLIRSTTPTPAAAALERCLLRIAMSASRRR